MINPPKERGQKHTKDNKRRRSISSINSKEAKLYSQYLKQKDKELNAKRGLGVIAKLFSIFDR